jgi:hypothetical protein
MTVPEMFEQYRINKAVFDNLLTELKYCDEAIEALQLPAYVMSHIPRSETNKIHQPTEALALRMNCINHDAIKALKNITKEIEKVEGLVNKLPERQQYIIKLRYVDLCSWGDILHMAEQRYKDGYPASKQTLRRDKRNALAFMQKAIDEQLKVGKFILVKEEVG